MADRAQLSDDRVLDEHVTTISLPDASSAMDFATRAAASNGAAA
jgi:hypothetical protein